MKRKNLFDLLALKEKVSSNKYLQKQKVVFLTSIENAKFKKMTTPGNVLKLKVRVISKRKNFYKFSGTAYSKDEIMATSIFSAMIQI